MSNNYFSPTQKISGGALFATWNSKEGNVYLRLLKQIANNPDKKGNFDGKNPLNIKLSQDEVADIVRAVRTSGESRFFHKFDTTTTSGAFKYYTIKATEPGKSDRQGFGLSVKRVNGDQNLEIKVGFNLGSAERFSLFLQNALVHIMNSEYSQDLKDYKESQLKKNNKADIKVETSEPKQPPPETESTDNLDF